MRRGFTVQRHNRQPGWCRATAQLLGAGACLLALVAMLLLPVLHAWESTGAGKLVRETAAGLSIQPGTEGALRDRPVTTQDEAHDPHLCPICQILSQARPLLSSAGWSVARAGAQRTLYLPRLLLPASPDLHRGEPRAPPTLR